MCFFIFFALFSSFFMKNLVLFMNSFYIADITNAETQSTNFKNLIKMARLNKSQILMKSNDMITECLIDRTVDYFNNGESINKDTFSCFRFDCGAGCYGNSADVRHNRSLARDIERSFTVNQWLNAIKWLIADGLITKHSTNGQGYYYKITTKFYKHILLTRLRMYSDATIKTFVQAVKSTM